jgi:P-type conjugative transfer protein TrbJ
LEQLHNLLDTLNNAYVQTAQQIEMVFNQIRQYENMIKNSLKLPMDVYDEVKLLYAKFANLSAQLRTIKGDFMALAQIFDQKYPDFDLIKKLAKGEGSPSEYLENWFKQTDMAIQAAFQVTGETLNDIVQNSDELNRHIDQLLSSPQGQMEAIEAGNQLVAIQIAEARRLNNLFATTLQKDALYEAQRQKEEQLAVSQWQNFGGSHEWLDSLSTPHKDSF